MQTSDLARLKQLEDESRRKDRIIARQALEIEAMKDLVEKNGWSPCIITESRRMLAEMANEGDGSDSHDDGALKLRASLRDGR